MSSARFDNNNTRPSRSRIRAGHSREEDQLQGGKPPQESSQSQYYDRQRQYSNYQQPQSIRDLNNSFNISTRIALDSGTTSASCVQSVVSEAASDIKENLTAMILVHHWKILAFGQLLSFFWACSGASQTTLIRKCGMSAPHLSSALIYTILTMYAILMTFIKTLCGSSTSSTDKDGLFGPAAEDKSQVPIDLTEIELNILKQELLDITGSDAYDLEHVVQALQWMILHQNNLSLRSIVLMCRLLTSLDNGIRPAARYMQDELLIDMIKNVILEDQNRNDRLLKHLALTLDERCQHIIEKYKSSRSNEPLSPTPSDDNICIRAGSGSGDGDGGDDNDLEDTTTSSDKELKRVQNILLHYTGKGSKSDIWNYRFGDVTRAVAFMKRDYFNKQELDQGEYGASSVDLVRQSSIQYDAPNVDDNVVEPSLTTPTTSSILKKTKKRSTLLSQQSEAATTDNNTRRERALSRSSFYGVSGYFNSAHLDSLDDLDLPEMAKLSKNSQDDNAHDEEPPQKTPFLGFIPRDASSLWFYFLLAFMNVEANLFIFYALRYSSLVSIMVIDSMAIISAMVLSSLWLQHRYVRVHILGASVCMIGICFNIFSDWESDLERQTSAQQQGQLNQENLDSGMTLASEKLYGDLLAAMGAILLGMDDVMIEYSVRNLGGPTECIGMLGMFGIFVSYIQLAIFDPGSIQRFLGPHEMESFVDGDGNEFQCTSERRLALLLTGSLANASLFIGTAQYLFISEAALLNLSLLTANLWSVLFSIFGERIVPEPLFWVGFILIIGGVFVYDMAPPPIEEIKDSEKAVIEDTRMSHDGEGEGDDSQSSIPLSRENQLDFMTRISLIEALS